MAIDGPHKYGKWDMPFLGGVLKTNTTLTELNGNGF